MKWNVDDPSEGWKVSAALFGNGRTALVSVLMLKRSLCARMEWYEGRAYPTDACVEARDLRRLVVDINVSVAGVAGSVDWSMWMPLGRSRSRE